MHAHDRLNRPTATKSYNILVCAHKAPHKDIDIIHKFQRKSVNRLQCKQCARCAHKHSNFFTYTIRYIRLFSVVSPILLHTLCAVMYDIRVLVLYRYIRVKIDLIQSQIYIPC